MKKQLAGILLCAALAFQSLTVFAAPKVESDGNVFDPEYYAEQNPDVAKALGRDEGVLYEHYKSFGKAEGRSPYAPGTDLSAVIQEYKKNINKPADYDAKASILGIMQGGTDADAQRIIDSVNLMDPMVPRTYIRYDLGDGGEYILGPEVIATLLQTNKDGTFRLNADGQYMADDARVRQFVNALVKNFSLGPKKGTFTASDGRQVKLNGSFSNMMTVDVDRETEYLKGAILSGKASDRIPAYKTSRTYVEVDLTRQKAFFYKDGKLVVSTDIVSGNTGLGRDTPPGVYKLLGKATDTYLTGANYSSFVNYWMPFIGNSYGLHDAGWRRYFGGNIYKTNGSHGCVNMPYENAKKIYENIDVGTPIVVFY